jgi:hypothetical protein
MLMKLVLWTKLIIEIAYLKAERPQEDIATHSGRGVWQGDDSKNSLFHKASCDPVISQEISPLRNAENSPANFFYLLS